MDIGSLRREYMSQGLNREDLAANPVDQFERWFTQASEADIIDPNAMTLATVNAEGQPSARTVLLKLFDYEGFVFFTNYGSRKAKDLKDNDKVALLFPWLQLNRQIRIEGCARKISSAESFKYFSTRPRGSQLGAWCSQQSEVISSRQFLEMSLAKMTEKFKDGEVPLPDFWGGYRVIPEKIEFWQGRENRLHDRFVYRHDENEKNNWQINRLAP
ncbi:pyridoxamine 5'-phosphate oxidase [Oleiphilus messinensis]|uniref:Pyridoxine/pyridoxamine 5'-phosphate oxidase n=1 Tax=Oleiphilus messinensis TaxID=141451 RepID=A0A1Y0ICK0_9GAMM|nr:pyridoxamine 5'-phosphate oxidase [Oleiphilus messinensis]ARU58191.1 pyridoxamine 5'-phosphate oxidase [Oleiphilus messinensis]